MLLAERGADLNGRHLKSRHKHVRIVAISLPVYFCFLFWSDPYWQGAGFSPPHAAFSLPDAGFSPPCARPAEKKADGQRRRRKELGVTEGDPATWTTRDGWASAPLALAISLPLPLPISTLKLCVSHHPAPRHGKRRGHVQTQPARRDRHGRDTRRGTRGRHERDTRET